MEKQYAINMIDFLQNSPCSFLAVENSEKELKENGFLCLNGIDKWELKEGGKYYVTRNGSTLIAFIIGKDADKTGFRLIGSHTDSPSFVIKPNSEIKVENNYLKLNTEGYGGMILSTWLDRPLSVAGRVILKGENAFSPKTKTIDFKRPIAIIPNLAINLNRDINAGHK